MAICRALDDANVEIDAIAAQVMSDPVLSARVLQIANSAMYGAGRQIASVPFAVTRLGLKTTRNLVLAAELYALGGVDAVRAEQVRQRSLLAAWLAPRLMAPHIDPDVATTAALLAGIGELLPELDAGPVASLPGAPPIQDEAAAYLMGLWQLPTILQQAVAWQRTPRLSGGRFGVVGAVHVATALAFGRPVDDAWLERCDMAAHLPGWRELAERMDSSAA
jgi:HD-like signal output (HDOD) protein